MGVQRFLRRPVVGGALAPSTTADATFDVVVVGGGGAGMAAAIEAARRGSKVVVLEKGTELRGSTGMSIGSVTASGTAEQRRAGIVDDPQAHFEDYLAISGERAHRENVALIRLLVESAAETVRWLGELGVVFYGPVQEPPHRTSRMHNALPSSRSYTYHLGRAARRLGVTVRLGCRAERLIVQGRRVAAVELRAADRAERITARRAVVLAGGDFASNAEMKSEFLGPRVGRLPAVNLLATGDCLRMARELGAAIDNVDVFDAPSLRFVPPPHDGVFGLVQRLPPWRPVARTIRWSLRHFPPAVARRLVMGFITTYLSPEVSLFRNGAWLVDTDGELQTDLVNPGVTVASLGQAGGYILFDQAVFEKFSRYPYYVATAPGLAFAYMPDFQRSRKDVIVEAPTIAALAGKLGIRPERLMAADRQRAAGQDEGPPAPRPRGPVYALGPVRAYLLSMNGGCHTSTSMEVLDVDGQPIDALFAAGGAAQGGVLLGGHGHRLCWAFTSGRLAGAAASAAAPLTVSHPDGDDPRPQGQWTGR